MTTRRLSATGDSFSHALLEEPMLTIGRVPLVYHPRSSSRVNHAELPDRENLQRMQLAFREQPFSDRDMVTFLRNSLYAAFAVVLLLSAAALTVGALVPPEHFWVPGAIGTVIVIAMLWSARKITPVNIVAAVLLPTIVLYLCKGIWLACESRFIASAVCSVLCFILVWRGVRHVVGFYSEWLFTDPQLTPAVRRRCHECTWKGWPLAVLLAMVTVLPVLTPFWTPLIILAFAGFMLNRYGGVNNHATFIEFANRLIRVFGIYFTYGMMTSGAPGVWFPERNLARRRNELYAMVIFLFLTLMVGLTLFFPLFSVLADNFRPPSVWSREAWTGPGALDWVDLVIKRIRLDPRSIAWFLVPLLYAPFVCLAAVHIIMAEPLQDVASEEHAIDNAAYTNQEFSAVGRDLRPEWQWYADRVRQSTAVMQAQSGRLRECDHLFAGIEPHAHFPVLLHEPLLHEHCYLVGDSGSGKTALGIMPLLIQLIRPKPIWKEKDKEEAERRGRVPMVVIDLKGDLALFNTVKHEAEQRGQVFKFFTVQKGDLSHGFNPITNLRSDVRTDVQLAQVLLDSLALNHGEGYGRSYYSRKARSILHRVLSNKTLKIRSIKDLYEAARVAHDDEATQETYELISTLEVLATYENLDLSGTPGAIHMPTLVQEREIAYFWLPAVVESVSVREIGKLALYSILTACIDRRLTNPGGDNPQVYVFIDEFQRIAGENFKVILEQARSFGLSLVLANQSVQDLKTPDADLRPSVRTNTRVKRYFSVTDPSEIELLSGLSGEELWLLQSRSHSVTTSASGGSSTTMGFGETQTLKPRLTVNDILAINDHPLDSILHVSRGSGLTQFSGLPIPVRCTYPLTEKEYRERQSKPWPRAIEVEVGDAEAPASEEETVEAAPKAVGTSISELENNRSEAVARQQAIDLERLAAEVIPAPLPKPLTTPAAPAKPASGASSTPPAPPQAPPPPASPTKQPPPTPGWGGGQGRGRGGPSSGKW